MTLSITCNACGTAKPIDAYERLASGGRRGVCIACRNEARAAYKRAQREALRATPEQQALRAQRAAEREARAARKEAARVAAAQARIAHKAAAEEARAARKVAEVLKRDADREAILRDELWEAMKRGRATRALEAVKSERDNVHTIRLRTEKGFVSIAEFACRVEERRACSRAVYACKTFEAVSEAVKVLEQPAPALERVRTVSKLWHEAASGPGLLPTLQGEAEEEITDLFAEAFGDWAPQWLAA